MHFPSARKRTRPDPAGDGIPRPAGPDSPRPRWRGLARSRTVYAIAALMLVVLLTGLATGFDLMVRLNYVFAAVLVVSYLWATAGLQRLGAEVSRPKGRLSVGDTITEEIIVRNNGGAPKAWVEVEDRSDIPGFRVRRVTGLGVLVSFSRFTASAMLPRRGEYSLGPLMVRASDPFDLFPQEAAFGGVEKLLVFPRIVALPDFAGPSAQLVGESSPRQWAHAISTDSSSVRQYVPGDSESRIHWLTTARVDMLMVKQFDRGSANHVWVVFDMDAGTVAGEGAESTDEYGATLAASAVDKYLRMALPVGYSAAGSESLVVYPERGGHQRERIMRHLASARPTGRTPLLEVLAGLEPRLSYSSSLIVITAAGDGEWTSALATLGRRGVRVTAALLDRGSFGGEGNEQAIRSLMRGGVRTFSVRRDVSLYASLSEPLEVSRFAAGMRAEDEGDARPAAVEGTGGVT